MTKSQIKAELRRSACEDYVPQLGCDFSIINCIYSDFVGRSEWLYQLEDDDQRTFFLLVAEAL